MFAKAIGIRRTKLFSPDPDADGHTDPYNTREFLARPLGRSSTHAGESSPRRAAPRGGPLHHLAKAGSNEPGAKISYLNGKPNEAVTPSYYGNSVSPRLAPYSSSPRRSERPPAAHIIANRADQSRHAAPAAARATVQQRTIVKDDTAFLIPAAREQDYGKLVVVLDLDETLVYAREGGVFIRPGVDHLLKSLNGLCEVIVWTAGSREYALEVIGLIDPMCAIQHCIYRHPMWWKGEFGTTKDLSRLGRPMEKVILLDNTPEVFRANPRSGLLVSDYLGKVNNTDRILFTISDIFDHVLRRFSHPKASDVFASKRIMTRKVRLEMGGTIDLYTLAEDNLENYALTPTRRALLHYLH